MSAKKQAHSRGAKDLRNDLARARDAFLASDDGKKCMDGTAHGQYLCNRLQVAFAAGWAAREAKP